LDPVCYSDRYIMTELEIKNKKKEGILRTQESKKQKLNLQIQDYLEARFKNQKFEDYLKSVAIVYFELEYDNFLERDVNWHSANFHKDCYSNEDYVSYYRGSKGVITMPFLYFYDYDAIIELKEKKSAQKLQKKNADTERRRKQYLELKKEFENDECK